MHLLAYCPARPDWYTTFCGLAGVHAGDKAAVSAGLPDVDGLDLWPLISGQVSVSPRSEIVLSPSTIISGEFKLLTQSFKYAVWQAPVWPNSSTPTEGELEDTVLSCHQQNGYCLFNIFDDESELEVPFFF